MRGGTSKGLYFSADDLPADIKERDSVLLSAMGSPDRRQIDGMGGSHSLTSKVAIVCPSNDESADVDYLFLQVGVDKPLVSDAQNCGNILAGVGPFVLEQGFVEIQEGHTDVRVRMLNTGALAVTRIQTPGKVVQYRGETRIDGVPGTASPISIEFSDIEGSTCGALLPTGQVLDEINGIPVTCIDMGMPVVLLNASDFGLSGEESLAELESNHSLKERVEAIRLKLGPIMNLGDVTDKTVPKMCLVSEPKNGGCVNTRSFIPHQVHDAIGVLASISVAVAVSIPGAVGSDIADTSGFPFQIEHPTGAFAVELDMNVQGETVQVERAALVRTARLLMRGEVLISKPKNEGKPV